MNKTMLSVIRNPVLQHGVFWILSFYILLNVFALSSSFQRIDYIYTAIFLLSLAIPVLLNLYIALPLFLRKGKYLAFMVSFLLILLLFSWLNQLIFEHFVDVILPEYFFISYYSFGDIIKFFVIFLSATTLLQMSKEWFELNTTRQKMLLLEKEKVDAELKALANQVNPHFLFNSLNVIYSLAVNQRKESPEAILKLSDILRYVIYDSSGKEVGLDAEIQLIRNYIDLQRFRVGKESSITFEVVGEERGLKVAPMLFLPLVENAFKHGIKGDVGNTFLNIRLHRDENSITFTVENNQGKAAKEEGSVNHGVGLENIRSRMDLLYPGAHELLIDDSGDRFLVKMTIRNLTSGGG